MQVDCFLNDLPSIGSRGVYINPYIGDLQRDLIEAIYKC